MFFLFQLCVAIFQKIFSISLGTAGEAEEIDDTFNSMLFTLILGIIFIFLILSAQFESFIEPFAIMAALPLAFIGALFGLFICHSNFSMISGIGILLLMGLVTKNAILLIDFAKKRIEAGYDVCKALVEAGLCRFRPIIMTSMAMMFAMMPVAVGIGDGEEARAPMAHAILGGLISSTILTLVVIPCLYLIIKTNRFTHKKSCLLDN